MVWETEDRVGNGTGWEKGRKPRDGWGRGGDGKKVWGEKEVGWERRDRVKKRRGGVRNRMVWETGDGVGNG